MKAAVLHQVGSLPQYEDFPDPIPQKPTELLLHVAAASIKNIDKARASGAHYGSHAHLPAVPGLDGVGRLADGTRVYAQGLTGMLAQKALIEAGSYTLVPDGLDDATAAALPNAVAGAALALRSRADIPPGAVVLINGATGVTGQLAVQLAKHYGAAAVIATGRNAASLAHAQALGADALVSLQQTDAELLRQLRQIQEATPIDIVLDYLWGHPLEVLLAALQGNSLQAVARRVRVVMVGNMAGDTISLSSDTLRSAAIELLGSGFGSLSRTDLQCFSQELLPEAFALAAAGQLTLATVTELANVTADWARPAAPGKRMVMRM